MKFERLEAWYVTPMMKYSVSFGDVEGLPRIIDARRKIVVLRAWTSKGVEAWSEIATTNLPIYNSESTVESWALVHELGNRFVGKDFQTPREAVRSLGYLINHQMFQSGFANLFWDADALEQSVPLYTLLGGTRKQVEGGTTASKDDSFQQVEHMIVKEKFHRIQVKVGPTQDDFEKVAKLKKQFSHVLFIADANTAFELEDPFHKKLLLQYGSLDDFIVEQPLAMEDIAGHIELQNLYRANHLPARICLDESVHTMKDLKKAVDGGIPVINIKVTRVGGLHIAREMIEYCQKHHVDTWIGGMSEFTAPGKAHSLAMATHPGVTLPSDISGTSAYFIDGQDPCVTPMEREEKGAYIIVPQTPGRGWEVDIEKMNRLTQETIVFQADKK